MEMGWKSCGAIDLYVDDGEQVYIHIHTQRYEEMFVESCRDSRG